MDVLLVFIGGILIIYGTDLKSVFKFICAILGALFVNVGFIMLYIEFTKNYSDAAISTLGILILLTLVGFDIVYIVVLKFIMDLS